MVITSNPWSMDDLYKIVLERANLLKLSVTVNIRSTFSKLTTTKQINIDALVSYLWPMDNGIIKYNDVRKELDSQNSISYKNKDTNQTETYLYTYKSSGRFDFNKIHVSKKTYEQSNFIFTIAIFPKVIQITTSLNYDNKEITKENFSTEIDNFVKFLEYHLGRVDNLFLDTFDDGVLRYYTMNTIRDTAYDKGKIILKNNNLVASVVGKNVNVFNEKTMSWLPDLYKIISIDKDQEYNVIVKSKTEKLSVKFSNLRLIKDKPGNSIKGKDDNFPEPYSFHGSCPKINEYIEPWGVQSYADNLYYPVCSDSKHINNIKNYILDGISTPDLIKNQIDNKNQIDKFSGTFIPNTIKIGSVIRLKNNKFVKLIDVIKDGLAPNNKNIFVVVDKNNRKSKISGFDIDPLYRENRYFSGLNNIFESKEQIKDFLISVGVEYGMLNPVYNFSKIDNSIEKEYEHYLTSVLLNELNISEIDMDYSLVFEVPKHSINCVIISNGSKLLLYTRNLNNTQYNTYVLENKYGSSKNVYVGFLTTQFEKPTFYMLSQIMGSSKKIRTASINIIEPKVFESIGRASLSGDRRGSDIVILSQGQGQGQEQIKMYKWTQYENSAVTCKITKKINDELLLDISVDNGSEIYKSIQVKNPELFKQYAKIKIEPSIRTRNPIISAEPSDKEFYNDPQNKIDTILHPYRFHG